MVDFSKPYTVVITTYSKMLENAKHHEVYKSILWFIILADERHRLRNENTKLFAAMQLLIAILRLIISGRWQLSIVKTNVYPRHSYSK